MPEDINLEELIEESENIIKEQEDLILVSEDTNILRVSASDANGFKAVILNLIGDYEPVVTDYEYRNNNNTYYSHSINIHEDWSWIASAAIFLVVLVCCFKLLGGLICRKR